MFLHTVVCAWANWYTNGEIAPFTYFASTMIVPPLPDKKWQTLFIWPGMQPSGKTTYMPINNGVLQPVLTFGNSCAPNPSNADIDQDTTWWISGQYVNTASNVTNYNGCFGGDRMPVKVGDELRMVMELKGTVWSQTIYINGKNAQVFEKDLQGQTQGWAMFYVEPPGGWYSDPPRFNVTNIELRATKAHESFCKTKSDVNPKFYSGSLWCSEPKIEGNVCKVKTCNFNHWKRGVRPHNEYENTPK
eukprot:NODE_893_length_3243_cov_0.465967.p3 type:complete len:246 gc:universal NODE_893_length_3243_cov_0.465967:281-1018(+)